MSETTHYVDLPSCSIPQLGFRNAVAIPFYVYECPKILYYRIQWTLVSIHCIPGRPRRWAVLSCNEDSEEKIARISLPLPQGGKEATSRRSQNKHAPLLDPRAWSLASTPTPRPHDHPACRDGQEVGSVHCSASQGCRERKQRGRRRSPRRWRRVFEG